MGTEPVGVRRQPVRVDCADGCLTVTVDRPEKRNALSRAVLAAIKSAFEEAAHDESVLCAVLTASGDRSFAAGGDLEELASIREKAEARAFSEEARAALQAIRSFPVPVVAALNGDALGGGAELAVAADMRVFAAHARIGFIQGRLALTTAWGGSADLVRLVGPSCALRLTTRCETLDAVSAQTLGLADAAARDGQPLEDAVAAFLAPMLKQRREVLAGFKSLANAGRDAERARFDALETEWFASTWVHEDHWSAVDAIKARSARGERGAVARVREA